MQAASAASMSEGAKREHATGTACERMASRVPHANRCRKSEREETLRQSDMGNVGRRAEQTLCTARAKSEARETSGRQQERGEEDEGEESERERKEQEKRERNKGAGKQRRERRLEEQRRGPRGNERDK